MVLSRVVAVQSKRVKAGYFKLYNNKSDQEIPKHIIQIGKNFSNLVVVIQYDALVLTA